MRQNMILIMRSGRLAAPQAKLPIPTRRYSSPTPQAFVRSLYPTSGIKSLTPPLPTLPFLRTGLGHGPERSIRSFDFQSYHRYRFPPPAPKHSPRLPRPHPQVRLQSLKMRRMNTQFPTYRVCHTVTVAGSKVIFSSGPSYPPTHIVSQ
jgi:hypothetical protein